MKLIDADQPAASPPSRSPTPHGHVVEIGLSDKHSPALAAHRSGNLIINYLNGLTEVPQLRLQTKRGNPDMYVIHNSGDHLAIYTTHYFR